MKNLFFLAFLIFLLTSCGDISFVSPQPEYIDALTEIPEKYHGEFMISKFPGDKKNPSVTSSAINGISIISDSLVVKERGNYFYVNIMNDDGYYELSIIRLTKFLNYESISLFDPFLNDVSQLKLFNVFKYDEKAPEEELVLYNVTVNQLSILTNLSKEYKVRRLK